MGDDDKESLDLLHIRALVLYYYRRDISLIEDEAEITDLIANTFFLIQYQKHHAIKL